MKMKMKMKMKASWLLVTLVVIIGTFAASSVAENRVYLERDQVPPSFFHSSLLSFS